ncbi:MAG: hypothetical protein WBG86_06315 [Polyangiales bacterium]
MATPIVVGANYFEAFETGNGAIGGAGAYFAYAADLDTTFVTLRNTVNTVIAEVNAIAGPNALFGQDVMFLDDASGGGPLQTGRIGVAPATVTINGGNAAFLDIAPGAVALLGIRTDITIQQVTFVGAADPTVYVAMDVNGLCSTSGTPGSQLFDIAECDWDGAAFTSVTDLLETFLDGDEWYSMRTEPALTPFNATGSAVRVKGAHTRLDNFSRLLGGYATNSDGTAIGPQQIGTGSDAAVFLAFGDGAGASDVGTGFFRSAADEIAIANDGNRTMTLNATSQVSLPLNSRVKGQRTATQSITNNSATDVDFTATDIFDITAWHDPGGGNPDQFVVPTGAGGTYMIVFGYEWDEPVVLSAQGTMEITVNATALPETAQRAIWQGANPTADTITSIAVLTAGQIVRARVTQVQSTGTAALLLNSATLSIVKVA